ncbi:MAG TPA: putative zinc-binding metallopeptidase [Terriglobales bacterium]
MPPATTTLHRNGNNRNRRGKPSWTSSSDSELLDLRLCDLALSLDGTELGARIQRLYEELAARGLRLRPPCWLSSEWFSPHDTPGIAIPFYLAHPRLKKLEAREMQEVEGGTQAWCMQLLRHEAGHAYETAYRLGRREKWRRIFGESSKPYPDYYSPKPFSRNFVLHLDWWYAQSHPVEDFAETFAVWLRPGADWRKRYQGWPALKKLEYVDELMSEIAGKPPLMRPGPPVEPLHQLRWTLRAYYRQKQARYGSQQGFYDRDLRRLFPRPAGDHRKRPPASLLLRRIRTELSRNAASWSGERVYTVHLVLKDLIQRSRELDLRVSRPEREVRREAASLLTRQTMRYLRGKKHRFAL